MSLHLAIDIGASSGRHILGSVINGKLELTEIHRFKNGFVKKGDYLCWEIEALFEEILTGIAKCKEIGKTPMSIGIDTWGVDFVLLDKNGKMIGDAVSYRDNRTDGMDAALCQFISEQELYSRTGIQRMLFNTIYQFMALQRQQPGMLESADGFLLLPGYLSYLLTGVRKNEYTNATTTALVNARTKDWDYEIIDKIMLPRHIFGEIVPPGTKLGGLLPEVQRRVGFDCDVVLPCTHDTGSAVVSAPIDENSIFLSSGTWSLMGVELDEPNCSMESMCNNLSNEGGYQYRYRYLKNIMGMWIIQSIRNIYRETYGKDYSFDDLCDLARTNAGFPSVVDVTEYRFLAPINMEDEIKAACKDSGQRIPANIGELMYCVYNSLAAGYAQTVSEIASITGGKYNRICIVGGGCQDAYLNELTASACARKVTAGPVEATAIGNILVQMIGAGALGGIAEARALVIDSFPIEEFRNY